MFVDDKKRYLDALYKPDLSRKGNVDERISSLLDTINTFKNYVTTSSCSGRILYFVVSDSGKKHDCEWPLVTHKKAEVTEFQEKLHAIASSYDTIWFKMESAILHVQCKTIEDAQFLVNVAKEHGFKRSGIFVIKPERVLVELISTEKMETIVVKDKKVLVSDAYIEVLVETANKKLNRAHKRIDMFEQALKKHLDLEK
ncbi:MAG: tRNA wybutosine-synthesizing 3 family protein [Candidatus Woesearchaeota archaeon]